MASAPRLLVEAVSIGMVSSADVGRGEVTVRPLPRSNAVHCIELRGDAVGYVKQAGPASRLDGDDTVRVEREALARLAPHGLAPALVTGGTPSCLWTRAVTGEEIAGAAHDPALLDAAASALGERLARWHALPATTAVQAASTPWPLRDELLPSMQTVPRTGVVERVVEAWTDPALADDLAVARSQWSAGRRFVHGDLSRHNVIVRRPSRRREDVSVTFVDLEASGTGHPAWDVVSAVETVRELDPRPGAPSVARFRTEYARGGGDPAPSPAWTRVRALVTAWQLAAAGVAEHRTQVDECLARALGAVPLAG